jgi:Flp pilus assembly protein TadG
MRRIVRRRERGQAIVMAAAAMVALVGAMAMVIDVGMFLVVQRQFQSAADAGALAGAWHDPVCLASAGGGCLASPSATVVATQVAQANADTVKQLCGGAAPTVTVTTGTPLNRPQSVNWIVVTVQCDAGYSFGRILNLTTKPISMSAAAAIGDRAPNGDITDFKDHSVTPCTDPTPDHCRIARLLD